MPGPDAAHDTLSAEQVASLLAAAQRRPQLADIPWHDDEAIFDGSPPRRATVAPGGDALADQPLDPVRRRIRDRYIGVRFAGVARGAADLENPTRVIKAARLCVEEREPHAALELLALAIAQNARDPRLRLAEIEIAWRAHDAPAFVAAARAFHAHFPGNLEWAEVARLGRRIAPAEPLFAQPPDARGTGPADDGEPRWIQPPWEAPPALDAAEFHRAMMQEDARGH